MSSVDRLLVNNLKTSLQQSAHNVGSCHFDFVVCMKEGRKEGENQHHTNKCVVVSGFTRSNCSTTEMK